jgi:IS30 family transposase
MMCDLRRERKTLRQIAQAIGRSAPTVSRELRRKR